jgi:hypothetical protein
MATKITWDQADFSFSNNPYTWDEVELIKKIAAGGAIEDPTTYFKENPKDKKKFIKILCKVQGTDYEENKEVKDISIRIQDVDLVVNEVLGVNLDVEI